LEKGDHRKAFHISLNIYDNGGSGGDYRDYRVVVVITEMTAVVGLHNLHRRLQTTMEIWYSHIYSALILSN
jgi:hypothetical protein